MTQVNMGIERVGSGYTLSVKTKYKTRYWCWTYQDEPTAQHVKDKIIERWNECPLQKFEDYTLIFVDDAQQSVATSIKIENMMECWNNTEEKRIDLKQVSGQ